MSISKERIVDCAQKLFHSKGYKSTSIDDIIKRAKVTKSNLYYHFKSKEELGLLILDIRIEEYERTIFTPTLWNKALTPEGRLKNYYNKLIAYHKKLDYMQGCPFGNLALELSSSNEKFRAKLSEFFLKWQKSIESCIKDGVKSSDFRADISPKAISQIILAHTEGAIMMVKTHRSTSALTSGNKAVLKLVKR